MGIHEEEQTINTEFHPDTGVKPENRKAIGKRKKKERFYEDFASKSSSSTATSSNSKSKCAVQTRWSRRRVVVAPIRRGGLVGECGGLEAIALPLGMSFAAVVAQVLEKKDSVGERMSVDHLSAICTSAVRESLTNAFGGNFDCFARNFGRSFGSTLTTLRLIHESSAKEGESRLTCQNSASGISKRVCCSNSFEGDSHLETELPAYPFLNQLDATEEVSEKISPEVSGNQELTVRRETSIIKPLNTFEKSIIEQTRSNDLKTLEISLTMRKLKLKEAELALSYDLNHLERSKLAMGISKASFKAEKFKTQLEDSKHTELLRKCIDCLVAGLFLISASLSYGAYVYSYKRITEASASCIFSPEESKSWWIPKPVSSFNSGLQTLKCQVQVLSRMLFGIIMVIAVAYLLFQRSASTHQTMPVTFILLLLGAFCGFAGKLCVDTLGGSGLHWLLYWETLCLLHFFSNVCTSTLFHILYGPVSISIGTKNKATCPTWLRQFVFFGTMLVLLPLCCGLLPFAGLGEWKDHLLLLATDFLSRRNNY